MSLIRIIDLKYLGDSRGGLVSLEQFNDVPFDIKRVYYLFDVKNDAKRGFHAHYNLNQILVCIKGSCTLILDDGKSREKIIVDNPIKGIFIDKMIWREMHDFSDDCVLLILASELYDENDYIRDYREFLREI